MLKGFELENTLEHACELEGNFQLHSERELHEARPARHPA